MKLLCSKTLPKIRISMHAANKACCHSFDWMCALIQLPAAMVTSGWLVEPRLTGDA